ncbi:tetraacyldisaccharide 4'-kinase [Derxia gummosa]|uniref:Tetraacyldisaccharide 4'-kinase n=1 Tax=Derxia gummosa DSM 723 TaxID=1121388 RepID=A0A8B6X1G9_9BURK|nr:tetraacyldisaccharide 4'-kinase [Derxia gummosa]
MTSPAAPGLRARLEGWLTRGWQRHGLVYWMFLDLSLLWRWFALRKRRRQAGRGERVGVPVIVVGNVTVGGTGKTPTVIALVEALRERGFTPGVVSRGHGGSAVAGASVADGGARRADQAETAPATALPAGILAVTPAASPTIVGDEPALIVARTGVPMTVGADRVAAARALIAAHPGIDVLLSDDGLQHYRLARDIELVLFDARGAGNRACLPAGPLREPVERPRDATLFVGCPVDPALAAGAPAFTLDIEPGAAWQLCAPERRRPLADWAGKPVQAAAGIGAPEKFFAMLRAHGLAPRTLALPDHARFDAGTLAALGPQDVLITEKDAIKCRAVPALAGDARLWVVPIDARLPDGLLRLLADRLTEKRHGPQAA